MQPITLHPVQSVTIMILADNFFDGLLLDQGVAKRASLGTQKLDVTTALMEGGQTFESPLAQHGFSALVTLTVGGQTHRVLFDTGATPNGLIANMHTFDISPKDIETIVLSHGHFDHTTGLDGVARTLGRTNLPVMIHPDFWSTCLARSQEDWPMQEGVANRAERLADEIQSRFRLLFASL